MVDRSCRSSDVASLGASRSRNSAVIDTPAGPAFPMTASTSRSPRRARSATLARNGSSASTLVSTSMGRASLRRPPHTGQDRRQPSIQLRNRAPRVTSTARCRTIQRPQNCIGRTVAMSPSGRLPLGSCVILRIVVGSHLNVAASRCTLLRDKHRSRWRGEGALTPQRRRSCPPYTP